MNRIQVSLSDQSIAKGKILARAFEDGNFSGLISRFIEEFSQSFIPKLRAEIALHQEALTRKGLSEATRKDIQRSLQLAEDDLRVLASHRDVARIASPEKWTASQR